MKKKLLIGLISISALFGGGMLISSIPPQNVSLIAQKEPLRANEDNITSEETTSEETTSEEQGDVITQAKEQAEMTAKEWYDTYIVPLAGTITIGTILSWGAVIINAILNKNKRKLLENVVDATQKDKEETANKFELSIQLLNKALDLIEAKNIATKEEVEAIRTCKNQLVDTSVSFLSSKEATDKLTKAVTICCDIIEKVVSANPEYVTNGVAKDINELNNLLKEVNNN
jgi:hypothetical protein